MAVLALYVFLYRYHGLFSLLKNKKKKNKTSKQSSAQVPNVFFPPLQLVQRIQTLLQLLFSLQVNYYLLFMRFVRH